MRIERPARLPDEANESGRDYQRAVDMAIDSGLADREADQVRNHVPLVRRGDRNVTELFRKVAWTVSAWTSLTTMFGDPLDGALPRDRPLEVALDKTVYWLSTLPPASGSKIEELGFMYGQARVMYLVEPGRVVILAFVPTPIRFQRMTGHEAS